MNRIVISGYSRDRIRLNGLGKKGQKESYSFGVNSRKLEKNDIYGKIASGMVRLLISCSNVVHLREKYWKAPKEEFKRNVWLTMVCTINRS